MYSLTEKSNSMFIIITQWPFFIALVPTKQIRENYVKSEMGYLKLTSIV